MNIIADCIRDPYAYRKLRHPHRSAGFTLIELMIAAAIVAILAAIAYPSYRNYVIRGQIVNATDGLSAMAANMERYYQDNRSYAAANGFTPPCSTSLVTGQFTLTCSNLTGTTYLLQAQGTISGYTFTYTLDNTNSQATTVSPRNNTWGTGCSSAWETSPALAC